MGPKRQGDPPFNCNVAYLAFILGDAVDEGLFLLNGLSGQGERREWTHTLSEMRRVQHSTGGAAAAAAGGF